MQKNSLRLTALGCISMLAACTGGQSGILPGYQSVNVPATTKLQFAVGTANYAGTPALNTVATFRQANGLSATFANTPSIVGPAGFTVPATASAGIDAGGSSITSTPQTPPSLTPLVSTTFGQRGGVFAYGFAPLNSTTSGPGLLTKSGFYSEPVYGGQFNPLLGPPATPNFRDGNTVSTFVGYPAGFTSFANVTLVPGTYALNVLVPSADPKLVSNLTASATLTSTALLPTFAAPTFTSDAAGGGSVGLVIPPGVTETIVFVQDGNTYYSFVVTGVGATTLTIPANLGPSTPKTPTSPTFASGDSLSIVAVGFDYPAFEAAPPANVSQTPTIVGANGQADLTASPITAGTE